MADIPTTEEFAAIVEAKIAPLYALIQSLNQQSPTNQDEIGGIDLAVQITGLAKPTIYFLAGTRQIPHSKPSGKKLYFSKKDLLNWIHSGKRRTVADLAETSS